MIRFFECLIQVMDYRDDLAYRKLTNQKLAKHEKFVLWATNYLLNLYMRTKYRKDDTKTLKEAKKLLEKLRAANEKNTSAQSGVR